jgi:hypothetical protein
MYTVITALAVSLIIAVVKRWRNRKQYARFFQEFAFTAVPYALCGIIIGIVLAGIISFFTPLHKVTSAPIKLVAMRSADGMSGTFIWGSGTMGSAHTYNFMMLEADGTFVPGSIAADGLVHIAEDRSLLGEGTWTTTAVKVDETSAIYRWSLLSTDKSFTVRHDFRVPPGTVLQQFSMR